LERTVRGIHTIDGGSRPFPVLYVVRASAIVDRLLYTLGCQKKALSTQLIPPNSWCSHVGICPWAHCSVTTITNPATSISFRPTMLIVVAERNFRQADRDEL